MQEVRRVAVYTLGLAFVLSLIAPLTTHAFVIGGSNLSVLGYPSHTCFKPSKPFSFSSQWEVDSYNSNVEQYINCINDYIENANNDIQRVKEKAQEALDEARN